MAIFDPPRGNVINVQGSGIAKLLGLGLLGFIAVILLFSAVTRVDSGAVGVVTLFGKVDTSEVLHEGIHLINPLKATHELSIRTQELKETASVPSSEGLVINLDTSLIYRLNPDKAALVYQQIGRVMIEMALFERAAAHTVGLESHYQILKQGQKRNQLIAHAIIMRIEICKPFFGHSKYVGGALGLSHTNRCAMGPANEHIVALQCQTMDPCANRNFVVRMGHAK